jgi:hypothetical protein
MTAQDLAADIFARVITDRILGNPKVWEVPEKQARGIAIAALEAAQVFAQIAWEGPQPQPPPQMAGPVYAADGTLAEQTTT